jgi:feruloyl esterase
VSSRKRSSCRALITGALILFAALAPNRTIENRFILHAASCEQLTSLTIPQVRITAATSVAAGPFEPVPGTRLEVPAFCRVVAVATPTPDSVINFEVWLPPADSWNDNLQGVGNTGWSGAIPYAGMAAALRKNYAAAGTDTGHTGDDLSFAAGHPEKIIDWAYRGVHVMTVAAKLIIRARQGALPQHAYFTGCSTGGAQGLMSAQRYPDDYDGIVAGNPGNDRVGRLASYIWVWNAAHQTPESLIPPEKLQKVNDAVISACDNLDGIKDGVIDDPRRCNFDPGSMLCRGEDTASCLTSRQLEALRKIYNGPHNARQVRQIFPGVPKGSEGGANSGWQTYIMEPPEPPRVAFWKHFVFNDPNWDFRTFDWDRDFAYARGRVGAIVDANNPDLRPFRERGGRIIMTAGWNDAIHVSEQAINYYDAVERTIGNDDRTREFFRLFMVPGMGHCAPGPGPSSFDALAALEMWVEHQVAPDRIIASRPAAGDAPARTRPLCPYPLVARPRGSGSTDEAASFQCVSPPKGK